MSLIPATIHIGNKGAEKVPLELQNFIIQGVFKINVRVFMLSVLQYIYILIFFNSRLFILLQ